MVVSLVDRLGDGVDVGGRAGGCEGRGQSEDNKVAQYGSFSHHTSLRDSAPAGCPSRIESPSVRQTVCRLARPLRYGMKCGATMLMNSREVITLVFFQNLGKCRWLPVIR